MGLPAGDRLLDFRDRAILKFYLYTGARIATGCSLNVSDFHQDGDEATLRFHVKGGKIKTKGIHFSAAEAKLQQGQTGVDVAGALAGLLDQSGHVVARKVQEPLKALCLFVGVNIHPLRVFDQLPLHRLGIAKLDDTGGKREDFGKLRCTEATCPRDDLEAVRRLDER